MNRMASHTNQVEDHMFLISQLHSTFYTQVDSREGNEPRRRRKRKNSKEESGVGTKKRKLSSVQANLLELNFGNESKLETQRKDRIAMELGLDPRQVAVWFQNRRARWKAKKIEEEHMKMKSAHEGVLLENCRLDAEVLKLKEQLSEAEKEIQRLSERLERISRGSPSSSFSMDADQPLRGEFGVEGFGNYFYLPENNYGTHGMEWGNLFGL